METTTQENVQEAARPWIEQRLAEGRYTCTIRELATLLCIGYDNARELCKGRNAPPGFYSGNQFKIWLPDLAEYMSDMARKRRAIDV